MSQVLVKGYRGKTLETEHWGSIAVVGPEGKLLYSAGDPHLVSFYRSSSKPIQAVPLLLHGLDEKYQLTQQELAVLCASHLGEPIHVETILGILKKAGFTEDDFIVKPTYPGNHQLFLECVAKGMPKRKVYHNCTGKHSGLLMLCRETDSDYHDYYKIESNAQQEILRCLAHITQVPVDQIQIGIDGCGVPVFAVPLDHMALSFLKLACPQLEEDPAIAKALDKLGHAMNACPIMIRGSDSLCLAINSDPNLVGKVGALGVYCLGMRKEQLGIAIKMTDGNTDHLPMVIKSVLQQLGYDNPTLYAQLDAQPGWVMYNDNDTEVGKKVADFQLVKHN